MQKEKNMVFESNTMRSPQGRVLGTSSNAKSGNQHGQRRKASRLTAKVDNDMLGSNDRSSRTKLTLEDELWLRNALQSRLPIF